MQLRVTASFLLLLGAAATISACGGDDDDEKTPATCTAICERQNQLCGDTDDCTLCQGIGDVNDRSGCADEFQAGLDCLAAADVCDDMSTVCPSQNYLTCLMAWCMTTPNEPGCQ